MTRRQYRVRQDLFDHVDTRFVTADHVVVDRNNATFIDRDEKGDDHLALFLAHVLSIEPIEINPQEES